jgi:hypothetical protein
MGTFIACGRRSVDRGSDASEAGAREVAVRIAVLCTVENVEALDAKRGGHALGDAEVTRRRSIGLPEHAAADQVASGGTPGQGGRDGKGGGIDPVVDGLVRRV